MKAVERVIPNSKRYGGKTFAHHKARYELAVSLQDCFGEAVDLGCGFGYGTDILRESGYKVTGIDINDMAIDYAQLNYPECKYIKSDLREFEIGKNKKLITFFEVIEHLKLDDGIELLMKIGKAIKGGGIFIMSVPRDIDHKNNGFHMSEWKYGFLKTVLNEIFKEVVIIGQDWDTAKFSPARVKENDFYIAICTND